jgi:hypothetical protein
MLFRAVSHIPIESIVRKLLMVVQHDAVPRYLRDDGGSSHGKASLVSPDKRALRNGYGDFISAVHEAEIRRLGKGIYSLFHGQKCGSPDVYGIDSFRSDNTYADPDGTRLYFVKEDFTPPERKTLGIVDTGKYLIQRKNDRRSHHGTSQRPPSRFIDTGDVFKPVGYLDSLF